MLLSEDTVVIDVPIFESKIAFIDDEDKFNHLLKSSDIDTEIPEWGESFGFVFIIGGENGSELHVFCLCDYTVGNVAHEAKHLAVNIMEFKGIPICSETEEVEAYLIGFLMDEIHKHIKPKQKNKRKPLRR
jgi:hypothetical protein